MLKENLSGTSWHTEFLKMNENDERRHKSRCVYHTEENYCTKNKFKCIGSSHCKYYNESIDIQETRKQSIKENQQNKNQSVLLYNSEDKEQIELFMNGLEYDELPELHKIAFNKKVADEFEFAGYYYKVLKKYDNKTYENSYKIVWEKKPQVKRSDEPVIKKGDRVTLYSITNSDIVEIVVGENYDTVLENLCIGKLIKEKFYCIGEEFCVQYCESEE